MMFLRILSPLDRVKPSLSVAAQLPACIAFCARCCWQSRRFRITVQSQIPNRLTVQLSGNPNNQGLNCLGRTLGEGITRLGTLTNGHS
jgi:hypothetical protein